MTQSCRVCLYNIETYPGLTFDDSGECSSCAKYKNEIGSRTSKQSEGRFQLEEIFADIKEARKKKQQKYDCVIGLSGGVDSSYLALLAREAGLNPLAIHFDNGWNTSLATHNIERITEELEIDLNTIVVDWNEFKSLQLAFLKASTPDGEVPTDHAIQASLWIAASKYGVKYLLSGMNYSTESTTTPKFWANGHSDWKYIKSVNKRFGSQPLKTYPHYTLTSLLKFGALDRIRIVSPLNYIEYSREDAKKILTEKLGWVDYGNKHYESVYTRFFQGVILPNKFGIDKRIAHLSDMIRNGEITREEGISILSAPTYDKELQSKDLDYFLKKMNLSLEEFHSILDRPICAYEDFPNNKVLISVLKLAVNYLRGKRLYLK